MRQVMLLILVAALLPACSSAPKNKTTPKPKTTFSSFDLPEPGERIYGKREINFNNMDALNLLKVYQELSGRTVIRPAPLPQPGITLLNEQPVTRTRALQLFDTALAANGIVMVQVGDDAVKAIPAAQATREPGPVINLPADQLPESSSYMVRTVHLKRVKAVELIPLLQPFAGLPNNMIASNDPNLLILRDYSANIRAMLKLIEEVEAGRKR
jgi:type II secretory pathway component GspD/PulD (secretin)